MILGFSSLLSIFFPVYIYWEREHSRKFLLPQTTSNYLWNRRWTDVMFSPLSVCLSVSTISQCYGRGRTKLGGQVGFVTCTNLSDFGEDSDPDKDTKKISVIRHHWQVGLKWSPARYVKQLWMDYDNTSWMSWVVDKNKTTAVTFCFVGR